jgi:hypothetical protein
LGKAFADNLFVDFVFCGGNGLARVDQEWFRHGSEAIVCGEPARICPPEEMIWSKSFLMERERFDGADVLHLIRANASTLDWSRLLDRFGPHWRILFAHLVLFGFVYPSHRGAVPARVMNALIEKLQRDGDSGTERICQGTLLSRSQYLVDITAWGYADARLGPGGTMSPNQVEAWTEAAVCETETADPVNSECETPLRDTRGDGGYMADNRSSHEEEDRVQEASVEYPGPRTSSDGERVRPDPANPPRPDGAAARQGRPSAAGGTGSSDGGRDAGASVIVPPLDPDRGEHPDTGLPKFPHRK